MMMSSTLWVRSFFLTMPQLRGNALQCPARPSSRPFPGPHRLLTSGRRPLAFTARHRSHTMQYFPKICFARSLLHRQHRRGFITPQFYHAPLCYNPAMAAATHCAPASSNSSPSTATNATLPPRPLLARRCRLRPHLLPHLSLPHQSTLGWSALRACRVADRAHPQIPLRLEASGRHPPVPRSLGRMSAQAWEDDALRRHRLLPAPSRRRGRRRGLQRRHNPRPG